MIRFVLGKITGGYVQDGLDGANIQKQRGGLSEEEPLELILLQLVGVNSQKIKSQVIKKRTLGNQLSKMKSIIIITHTYNNVTQNFYMNILYSILGHFKVFFTTATLNLKLRSVSFTSSSVSFLFCPTFLLFSFPA